MGLSYKILWVDDQIEELIDYGLQANIKQYLTDLGFEPYIESFEDIASAEQYLSSKKYDLILSDYNISESGNGDVLIRRVREGKIYTEVLFYSAQANFDAIAKSLYQDRVSFISISAQDGYDKLEEKAKWLIDQTLTKLQEIESIRGLVMAETSRLDDLVKATLIIYFESSSENKSQLRKSILKSLHDSLRSNFYKNGELKLESKDNAEIVQSRLFDASKMARSIKELIDLEKINQDDVQFENFFENYKKDILDPRNDLAHAKASIDENGREYLSVTTQGSEKKILFDHVKVVEIRRNLSKYNKLLLTLQGKISSTFSSTIIDPRNWTTC